MLGCMNFDIESHTCVWTNC